MKSKILGVLENLVESEGVKASAVLSKDGMLLSYCNGGIPAEVLPSILAMMAKCAEKCLKLLDSGEMDYILIKAEKGLVLTQLCPTFIISVMVNVDINMDFVLSEVKKARKRIKDIL